MPETNWKELADQIELIARQRRLVAAQGACESECRAAAAHQRALTLLERDAVRRSPEEPPLARTAFDAARRAADVLKFEIPASHRRGTGALVTGAKRAAISGLKPLWTELLRSQHRFNVELIEVYKLLANRRATGTASDQRSQVRSRLEPLVSRSNREVRTHRDGPLGQVVALSKRASLQAVEPLVRPLFGLQRRWNEEAMVALELAASPECAPDRNSEAVAALLACAEEISPARASAALRATAPLWNEVHRRQAIFNREFTLAIAELLGVRAPAVAPPEQDYPAWLATRPPPAPAHSHQLLGIQILRGEGARAFGPAYRSLLKQSHREWRLLAGADEPVPDDFGGGCVLRVPSDPEERDSVLAREGIGHVLVVRESATLSPLALDQFAAAAAAGARCAYSDEDRLEGRRLSAPFFKPDFSPDLLRAFNYFGSCILVDRAALRACPRSSDPRTYLHRLALEASAESGAVHLREVLFHRAEQAVDEVTGDQAGAVAEHLSQRGVSAQVEAGQWGCRVRYLHPGRPRVSIIVPFRDRPDLLERLCATLLERTPYSDFELLLVSNQSVLPETKALLDRLNDPRIVKLTWDEPFNFSAINNFAAARASGELLLFLNNDMEVTEPGWLEELVGQALRPEVGAVGAQLLFPDGSVQHAGAVVGLAGFAGHPFWRFPDDGRMTAWGRASWPRTLLAVTGACLMMRRQTFDAVGGFDERFVVEAGDIDLCLRVRQQGLWVVYTPHARLVHHESASRRHDAVPAGDAWNAFLSYRPWLRDGDPYFNPNLTLARPDLGLRDHQDDGEILAVKTLVGMLPRGVQISSRAHSTAQRHLADHLPAYGQTAHRTSKTESARGPIRTVRIFASSSRSPDLDVLLELASACERHASASAEVVVLGTGIREWPERDARPAMRFIDTREDLGRLPPADLLIAGDWRAAWAVAEEQANALRAYFVRDQALLRHPAGTEYGLAEDSYRLGLYGIFHGPGLEESLGRAYGMRGCAIELPIDRNLFHARQRKRGGPPRLFLQADPTTDEEAFELAVRSALRARKALGDALEIVTAGPGWSLAEFGAQPAIRHLGPLSAESRAAVYRTCDAALALGFLHAPTRSQLELMASGVALVSNRDPGAAWALRDGETAVLAEPTVSCLAEQVRRLASEPSRATAIGSAAASRMATVEWAPQITRLFTSLRVVDGGR